MPKIIIETSGPIKGLLTACARARGLSLAEHLLELAEAHAEANPPPPPRWMQKAGFSNRLCQNLIREGFLREPELLQALEQHPPKWWHALPNFGTRCYDEVAAWLNNRPQSEGETEQAGNKNSKWHLDACMTEAKKYQSRQEWRKNSNSSYVIAARNKWIDRCCDHMTPQLNRWHLEGCMDEAKKYSNRSDFQRGSKSAYLAAWRNGWLDQCCQHMAPMTR